MSDKEPNISDFSAEEQELVKLFETVKQEVPPEAFLKDFELEVIKKVNAQSSGVPMGAMVPAVCLLVAVMALLGVLLLMRPEPVNQPEVEPTPAVRAVLMPQVETKEHLVSVKQAVEVAVKEELKTQAPETLIAEEEAEFNQMAADIFILEMLGEGEGLFDDFERLETDLEFIALAGSIAPTVG